MRINHDCRQNSQQRFILYDTIFGTTAFVWWSEHEGIKVKESVGDAALWRSSWDDALLWTSEKTFIVERFFLMEYSKMRSESSVFTWKAKVSMIHLESYMEECAQDVWERILHESLYAHCVVESTNMEADGDDSDGISKLCTCEFDTRNLARMGTNLETARRILGITTRPMSTEDLVLIASADRCKRDWPCWGLHRGDRWSKNKEGSVDCAIKGDMEHQKVFMRFSQCEILTRCQTTVESTSPAHTFCRRPVCRLNQQGVWLKLDVGEFVEQRKVIEVEILRHRRSTFPGTTRQLIYIWPERVLNTTLNFERRMRHCVEGKHNAVWLHNPNQGVITTVQEDESCTKTEVTRRNTDLIRWFQNRLESIARTKQIPNHVDTTRLVHVFWIEFVPTKRDVRDLVVQIGNHKSKSEMLIQSETASNAGETENHSMDQFEAIHQKEHEDAR